MEPILTLLSSTWYDFHLLWELLLSFWKFFLLAFGISLIEFYPTPLPLSPTVHALLWWYLIFLKFALDMIPEGFNGIEVWRLSRPVNYNDIILVGIHLSLNFYKLSHTILAHMTSYHKVVPSSMFDCGCSSLIRWGFTSLFPHIHLSIWLNLINFSLITS